jgi:FKBP-type peptidyl-prolyl cis-trans isomerase FkpA
MKNVLIILFATTLFFSCGKDQMTTDEELIQQYIDDNNLLVKALDDGLYVVIDAIGGEERPALSNEITVDYEGKYLDGEKFDSSYDRGKPIVFPLSGFIDGWRMGIPEFGRGGRGTIIIPSHLGYGSNPPTGIRKNAVLVFDIELIDFN